MEDGKENETRVYLHHKSGFRLPVMIRVSPLRDARGEVIGAVEIFSDNSLLDTSLKKIRDLETQAFSDALTELPNRRYAEITLGTRQDQADRYGLAGFGVIFADVDRFKSVNDTYGHETGDLVLRMVAGTLKYGVRDGDVVCRWGGEEFVAIVGTDEERVISDVAERLRALIAHRVGSLPIAPRGGGRATDPSRR